MNSFLNYYLSEIIPEPFQMATANGISSIGVNTAEDNKNGYTITIKNPPDRKDLLISPSLALGEAYMRGDIDVDRNLFEVVNLFMGRMAFLAKDERALRKLLYTSLTKANQKKEVSFHYDIGNRFYQLWLDETMSYSCAYFKDADKINGGTDIEKEYTLQPVDREQLKQAQIAKADHILEKLQIEPGMTLLDIGCGWGYLLKRAAEKYNVRGMGITLSEEQYKAFSREIEQKGMEKQISVRQMDYRELEKSGLFFDRVVSVGMIEHVGRGNYDLFLRNVSSVLKEGGLFLLHYISALKESPGNEWIKKYIFPGGVIPSLREILWEMAEQNFCTIDVESLRRHYTKTLLSWYQGFLDHREEMVQMQGITFVRMWELYLTACAAGFYHGIVDLHQILMSKGVNNKIGMVRMA